MKRYVLTALAALVLGTALYAIPARPGKFTYTQPDGTRIVLQRFGDEWNHWTTDASGRMMTRGADGFYRIATFTEEMSALSRRKAAAARRAEVNRARVRAKASGNVLTRGQRHIPVILAAFSDVDFVTPDVGAAFSSLLNQSGYSYNGAVGSVQDFYVENSHGIFTPVFDVYGPVTLSGKMSVYGGNTVSGDDKAPELALFQAAKQLDETVDFSHYDNDGDGYVDMVLFYYPGLNEAEYGPEDNIWPHSWNMTYSSDQTILEGNDFDGLQIDNYFCTSELSSDDYGETTRLAGIGTTCHEFGHSLGLPDFYDTDYGDSGSTFGENHGCGADLYSYSTMCSGSYNDAGNCPPYFNLEELRMLDWVDDTAFRTFAASGSVTLPPINEGQYAYRIPATLEGEYFLLESRGNSGWDAALPGGPGMIVYHIDKSSTRVSVYDISGRVSNITAHDLWYNWSLTNQINENAQHPCGYLVPAMDQNRISQECYTMDDYGYDPGNYQALPYDDTKIPFPGRSGKTSYTPVDWSGNTSDFKVTGIARNASSGAVTFTITVPSEELDYNVIDNPGNGVYSAGSRFAFNLVESVVRAPQSVSWYFDDEPVQADSVTLTAGTHLVEAHIVLASGHTKIVTLEITVQ